METTTKEGPTYKISRKKAKVILDRIGDLEKLFDDRIVELHETKGFGIQQARHAYLYYRSILWEVKYGLRDNLVEQGTETEKQ